MKGSKQILFFVHKLLICHFLLLQVFATETTCPGFTQAPIPDVCEAKKLADTGCPVLKNDCDQCALMGCKWQISEKENRCLKVWQKSYPERRADVAAAFTALNIADVNSLLTKCQARVTTFGEYDTEEGKKAFGKDEVSSVRKDFFKDCPEILDATSSSTWAASATPDKLVPYLTGEKGLKGPGWATRKEEAKMSNDKAKAKDQKCRFRARHFVVVCMMNIIREVEGYKRINPRAVGSAKMDSDYDVGVSGPDTLKFVALFTYAFTQIFEVPSSFMFDTNMMVASAFDWMKTDEMKAAQIAAGLKDGYDILTERPKLHWSMAIMKPPSAMNYQENEERFYEFELQAAHAKLCYFAESTAGSRKAHPFEFPDNCSQYAAANFKVNDEGEKDVTMRNDNKYKALLKLKKDFEENYTNNPECNELEQLSSADQNFIHTVYASPLWDKGSFAPKPDLNGGKDFLEWQHSMTVLQIVSQEAYHTVGPLIVTVVLSDIMVGAFSSEEVLQTFWNAGAKQWVAHIPPNYLMTALIENYGDMYKEYSKEVVKNSHGPQWTEFVFMSVKYLSRVCEAALALDARRDAQFQLSGAETKLVQEVGATVAWVKDALRSRQGTYSTIQRTLELPSEKLGQELMKFAKDIYIRMLTPFDRNSESDVAAKTLSLDDESELLQLVRAQFYSSFTGYFYPKEPKPPVPEPSEPKAAAPEPKETQKTESAGSNKNSKEQDDVISRALEKKKQRQEDLKFEGQNSLKVDHLLNHGFWEGHMPAFLIPSMDDPDTTLIRLEAVVLDIKKLEALVEKELKTYPWTKYTANIKAYWDESPRIRSELNARFGILKVQNPSPTYVIETMERGSSTDSVVKSIPLAERPEVFLEPAKKPQIIVTPPKDNKAANSQKKKAAGTADKSTLAVPASSASQDKKGKRLAASEAFSLSQSFMSSYWLHIIIIFIFLLATHHFYKSRQDEEETMIYLLDDEI